MEMVFTRYPNLKATCPLHCHNLLAGSFQSPHLIIEFVFPARVTGGGARYAIVSEFGYWLTLKRGWRCEF
jgi:hypothetical protein